MQIQLVHPILLTRQASLCIVPPQEALHAAEGRLPHAAAMGQGVPRQAQGQAHAQVRGNLSGLISMLNMMPICFALYLLSNLTGCCKRNGEIIKQGLNLKTFLAGLGYCLVTLHFLSCLPVQTLINICLIPSGRRLPSRSRSACAGG